MRLIADTPRANANILTGDIDLTLRISPESKNMLDELLAMDGRLAVDVKKWRPQRSLSANAYLWVLCDKIAKRIHSTKELIYRELIKRVGEFTIVPVMEKDVERMIEGWSCRGVGWFAEPFEGCKLDGCVRVMFYIGSSTYDTDEMSRLIDEAISEAQELGIDTATPDEVSLMKARWADEKQTHKGA